MEIGNRIEAGKICKTTQEALESEAGQKVFEILSGNNTLNLSDLISRYKEGNTTIEENRFIFKVISGEKVDELSRILNRLSLNGKNEELLKMREAILKPQDFARELIEIDGVNKEKIIDFYYLEANDIGKVISGKYVDKNGANVPFWLENGKYVSLSQKLENDLGIKVYGLILDILLSIEDGKTTHGKYKDKNGAYIPFWLENGKYTSLLQRLEEDLGINTNDIIWFHIGETDDTGKVIYGAYEDTNGNLIDIKLKNGKYSNTILKGFSKVLASISYSKTYLIPRES